MLAYLSARGRNKGRDVKSNRVSPLTRPCARSCPSHASRRGRREPTHPTMPDLPLHVSRHGRCESSHGLVCPSPAHTHTRTVCGADSTECVWYGWLSEPRWGASWSPSVFAKASGRARARSIARIAHVHSRGWRASLRARRFYCRAAARAPACARGRARSSRRHRRSAILVLGRRCVSTPPAWWPAGDGWWERKKEDGECSESALARVEAWRTS